VSKQQAGSFDPGMAVSSRDNRSGGAKDRWRDAGSGRDSASRRSLGALIRGRRKAVVGSNQDERSAVLFTQLSAVHDGWGRGCESARRSSRREAGRNPRYGARSENPKEAKPKRGAELRSD
jgi:hypothetical protein